MIDTLYVNGCSWTAGDELECDQPYLNYMKEHGLKFAENNNWDILNLDGSHAMYTHQLRNEFNWAGFIKKKLNANSLVNDSMGGGSNDRILRTTVDFILKYPEENRDKLLVIIGWTESSRREFYFNYTNMWERFTPTMEFTQTIGQPHSLSNYDAERLNNFQHDYIDFVHNDEECVDRYFKQIYLLSNLLENLKIKYFFFESMYKWGGLLHGKPPDKIRKIEDKCSWLTSKKTMYQGCTMQLYSVNNKYPTGPHLHTLTEGHKNWALHLLDKMMDRKIITEYDINM